MKMPSLPCGRITFKRKGEREQRSCPCLALAGHRIVDGRDLNVLLDFTVCMPFLLLI